MKKIVTAFLAMTLLLACVSLPALAEGGVNEETAAAAPETVPGTVRGAHIPVILRFLERDEAVEVVGYADEAHALIKTESGEEMVQTQFLRFPGEEYEAHTVYSAYATGLYETYDRLGEPKQILGMNTQMEVLEALEDCIYVRVGEETGFVSEGDFSENTYKPGFSPQDGGDISMAAVGGIRLLSDVQLEEAEPRLGAAQCRIPGVPVIARYCDEGEQVDVLTDQTLLEPIEGYLEILDDGILAYLPQPWTQQEGEEDFTPAEKFTGFGCKRYDNHLLWGSSRAQDVPTNTKVTVLWDTGKVAYVRLDEETFAYIRSESLFNSPVSASGAAGGAEEWTPAAL